MDNIEIRNYKKMGAHIRTENKQNGVRFSVWAPNARQVSVAGDFNDWNGRKHKMIKDKDTGMWSLFIPGLKEGDLYKYDIEDVNGKRVLKSDPYGFLHEKRPNTASIVYDLFEYQWNDVGFRRGKRVNKMYEGPINIYEVHLGSWKRKKDGEFMTYRELADELVEYTLDMGYTHIEIMPIIEHPYDGSWGYQGVGYYSVTSRYGEPRDFMYFVDKCHQAGIGVILDWIPAHFCKDIHGLAKFDGTCLYEYGNHMKAENYQWGTLNFDLGRDEVISYLISNAIFYIDVFHIDGLRVDAVSSMLYLDFCKEHGQWIPNRYGGRENLEAIEFMRKMNETIYENYPNTFMIAEESSAWPLVSSPTYLGGLGYNYKWNMGWMNDILEYMEKETIHRKWHHNLITFSIMYTYSENFILPLSHDEVVHGKKSLLDKMPGDYWQKFANLRLLYGYMMGHPGKKLLFMGGEFGQFIEWKYDDELDWFLLDYDMHEKVKNYTRDLNALYKEERSLWELDHKQEGFEWIDPNNSEQSIITFMRKGKKERDLLIIVCNFTPQVYEKYKIGVPFLGEYQEVFNSDYEKYGGSNFINKEILVSDNAKWNNQKYSLEINIPPLGVAYFKLENLIEKSTEKKG
ncbi:1,4-alpha-glucan-branching enzyme GlgB [Gottschalkia acidurici 9a]|uniref:1,4-alpha-glucan branching enzyme GlgB n=1 Tax=Gottschalkia acidurici (strain ATCC 7906 / DSM 604 / BCRC 14475 / CIP 104303 / KCTC 5404 / NCIMB 10678 / 9a) TaxID=1128398 RepID=K0AWQ8_GOTA9|nr:1,4-alpha-glucan branching protein GlgB [Gottschalkia acidurici]AFS77669.1 1,4-alpha-glucan-branching enzyme GlgB [Gottschalkia acidurici 9a]